ncbi:hypothetical protein RD149_13740 [Gordonia westfalica]|uniref:Hydroxyneurosporene synthase (CrtC) n=1 Tax=Gordonia westfalica TaxID=158898 RepID=A0ABU2GTP3_9ACTN|nr:hypothetical protein [Gordonia westfalica]MDS1114831.1 hypothetical protein [Gordonia westfalica]
MTSLDEPTRQTELLHGDNPFHVDPTADLLQGVPADVPGWSETMFFHVWSPAEEVGVFIHCGRWPDDPDLWWAQVIAMLPDGRLLVDRSWGRALDERGPATGNLRVACIEPLRRWRLTFDGAGEKTDLSRMVAGPSGAGPAQAFGFDIEIEAAAPVWDMHGALGIYDLSWAALHHTQGFRAVGTLRAGRETWDIRGVAVRDHSSGPRDVSKLGGLNFFVVVFPETGRVINGLVNWRVDGTVDHRVFTVFDTGGTEIGGDLSCTGLDDYRTHEPHRITLRMNRNEGEYRLDTERLHGYTLTFLSPNENINGVALDEQDDALVITQSTVRVTAPDGDVGYGVFERDYRPSQLPSPEER